MKCFIIFTDVGSYKPTDISNRAKNENRTNFFDHGNVTTNSKTRETLRKHKKKKPKSLLWEVGINSLAVGQAMMKTKYKIILVLHQHFKHVFTIIS